MRMPRETSPHGTFHVGVANLVDQPTPPPTDGTNEGEQVGSASTAEPEQPMGPPMGPRPAQFGTGMSMANLARHGPVTGRHRLGGGPPISGAMGWVGLNRHDRDRTTAYINSLVAMEQLKRAIERALTARRIRDGLERQDLTTSDQVMALIQELENLIG